MSGQEEKAEGAAELDLAGLRQGCEAAFDRGPFFTAVSPKVVLRLLDEIRRLKNDRDAMALLAASRSKALSAHALPDCHSCRHGDHDGCFDRELLRKKGVLCCCAEIVPEVSFD